jgi:RNA polymerase sigma factor (sigma-70 family)
MEDHNEISCWHRFIAEGEVDALSEIYRLYVNDLFSYGMKIHPEKHMVKDAIQEVFIQLIERQKQIKLTDKVKVYIFKSLRNKILEDLRTKNRKNIIEINISQTFSNQEKDAEQKIISCEEEQTSKKIISSALQSLSGHQREAVFLRYTYNCDYDQISEILGIDVASSRTLIYRSLKNVKAFIREKYNLRHDMVKVENIFKSRNSSFLRSK